MPYVEYVRNDQEEEETNHPRNSVLHLSAHRRAVLSPQPGNDPSRVPVSQLSVKLGNLLIDSHINLKLADFGLTTKL